MICTNILVTNDVLNRLLCSREFFIEIICLKDCCKFLSKVFKISKSKIALIKGDTSRQKDLLLDAKFDTVLDRIKVLIQK